MSIKPKRDSKLHLNLLFWAIVLAMILVLMFGCSKAPTRAELCTKFSEQAQNDPADRTAEDQAYKYCGASWR